MGGCFSSRSSSSSTSKNIRLVHLSGYVEDFEQPISVNQIISGNPTHFVCTSLQLLSSYSKPLEGDTQLQPGNVYFMLPYSILEADVSPVYLASLAKRLIAKAKTCRFENKKSLTGSYSPLLNQHGLSNVWSSPSMSPGRVAPAEQTGIMYGGRSSGRGRSWRPLLDTIREKSFNRRSESDLQEKNH